MNASEKTEGLYACLLTCVLAAGAAVSIRIAAAEYAYRLHTPGSVRLAAKLEPGDARYQERLATIEPATAIPALKRAVVLNPYLTSARIDVALRTEFSGDATQAEQLLLATFEHDRMYLPRWTLANFYFRRGTWPKFWQWVRASAEYANLDLTPLFDLCWRTGAPADLILENVATSGGFAQRRYLAYLIASDRLEAAGDVYRRLLSFKDPRDAKLLLNLIDKRIERGDETTAAGLWNAAAGSGLLPYAKVDQATGTPLTNGDFHAAPSGQGFDWHPVWNPDALLTRNRVEFSGRQPDQVQILWQPLVLVPRGEYKLRCRYSTRGIAADSGLRWRLLRRKGMDGGPDAYADSHRTVCGSGSLASDEARELTWNFQAPPEGSAQLSLDYRREPGTVRIAGTLELESVSLELLSSR